MSSDFSILSWGASFLAKCPTGNLDVKVLSRYLAEGNFRAYLDHTLVTSHTDPEFPLAYLAQSFLKKCLVPGFEAPARRKAVERFWEAEAQCAETNRRLDPLQGILDPKFVPFLERAKGYVYGVLGTSPQFTALVDRARFTDGSDLDNPYGFTSNYQKWAVKQPSVTQSARSLATLFASVESRWAARLAGSQDPCGFREVCVLPSVFRLVPGNRVSFVPKNAKTDRAIAVEPLMNIYMQRAVGVLIRDRLKSRAKIDLRDQTRNQQLAWLGSATDDLATIDLSMASDTVSRALVALLLPPKWHTLLDCLRSKVGTLSENGCTQTIVYEKFSSMGNGYTFELESLIFWALCKAVYPEHAHDQYVSVYGDDLVVPSHRVDVLLDLLSYCGFEANREKTFVSGPFRESCGKDYHEGRNIRPFLIEENLLGHHRRGLYKLANALDLYRRRLGSPSLEAWLRSEYSGVVAMVKSPHVVPFDFPADAGLWSAAPAGFPANKTDGTHPCRCLLPAVDEKALEDRARKRGRSARRRDPHLLMMVALRRVQGAYPLAPPLEPSDLFLDVSKGSPVKWHQATVHLSAWRSEPADSAI